MFQPETRTFVDRDILVAGDTIAAHVEDATDYLRPETATVDATDSTVVPGFIDAHTHIGIHQTIETAYPAHLRGGTTTVVTEVASMGVAFGPNAVEELLDSTADLPHHPPRTRTPVAPPRRLRTRPLLAIQTLTFTGVPARKLTCSGYAEVREKSVVGLTPD